MTQKINPEHLKTLLARTSLSQKELAGKIGVVDGTVSRWKQGKIQTIRSGTLAKLCSALGTTPEVLR